MEANLSVSQRIRFAFEKAMLLPLIEGRPSYHAQREL
jgi:hypothetical protein